MALGLAGRSAAEARVTTLDGVKAYFNLPDELGPSPVEIRGACRADFGPLLKFLRINDGVEVGTYRGRFAEITCGRHRALRLTCVDAWSVYPGYTDFTVQAELDRMEQEARVKLAPYGTTFIKAWSVEGAKQFADGSISWLYIDANHAFEALVSDLAAWVPKVRPGGIVSGHDYRHFRRSCGIRVVEAVDGYTAAHDIAPWFLLGRNKVRKREVRDPERSFFWVTPE